MDYLLNEFSEVSITRGEKKKGLIKESSDIIRCPYCNCTETKKDTRHIICKGCLSIIKSYENIESTKDADYELDIIPNMKTRTTVYGNTKFGRTMQRVYTYISVPTKERSTNNIYKEILGKYCRHLDRAARHDSKNKISKDLIARTVKLYNKVVENSKIHRNPLKTGIISICFHYVAKENYIIWTKKELSEIFEVDIKHITKGNNIINKICRINHEFRGLINRSPITLIDMIEKINHKFPSITREDIIRLKNIVNRIKMSPKVINNTPTPIISGILLNYVKLYGIKHISIQDIQNKLSVSPSSINKYSNYFSYAVYNIDPYYYSSLN